MSDHYAEMNAVKQYSTNWPTEMIPNLGPQLSLSLVNIKYGYQTTLTAQDDTNFMLLEVTNHATREQAMTRYYKVKEVHNLVERPL